MVAPGWNPDPLHRHQHRWWDGTTWTDHVADGGVVGTDPMVLAPVAPVVSAAPTTPPTDPPLAPPSAAPTTAMPVVPPAAAPTGQTPLVATVPPLAPSGGTRRTWIAVAGVGAVAALVVALLVVGGDDGESSTAPTTDAEVTTPSPTNTIAGTTTAAPTTVAPTTTSTTPPTTAAPTTAAPVIVPATDTVLLGVLPPSTEIPGDWVWPEGDSTWTSLDPVSGPYTGFCGGGNTDARIITAGGIAHAGLGSFGVPTGAYFDVRATGFASPADASYFMALTRNQASSCPQEFYYELPEGPGEGQFDGFTDGDPAGVMWSMADILYVADAAVAGIDETVQALWHTTFATVEGGVTYSGIETTAYQFERIGAIVIIHRLDSWHDFDGFSSGGEALQATPEDLAAIADGFRPGMLQRMHSQSLI